MKNFVHLLPGAIVWELVLCVLAIVSFSCIDMPLAPVAPMSEIKLEGISLFDITKTYADFTAKDTSLKRNSDGTSSYVKSETVTPQSVPIIKLQSLSTSQRVGVGQFSVDAFSVNQSFKASTFGLQNGPYPFLPSITIPLPAIPIIDTSDYDYVKIASGLLSLVIINNMPVPIDFPSPIVLRNNWQNPVDNSDIFSFTIYGSIYPGDSVTITENIGGKLLRGLLITESIQMHTPGSSVPIILNSSSGVSISFQSTNLIADSALAKIPSQTVASVKDSKFVVDDSTVVQSATFSAGSFIIDFKNNVDVNVGIQLKFNDIVSISSGLNFIIDTVIQAQHSASMLIDAKKWKIQTTASNLGTTLTYSVNIKTINSAGLKKTVTKNDYLDASFTPRDSLVVKSLTGKIKPTNLNVNIGAGSGIREGDIGKFSAQVALKGLQLTLRLKVKNGFPSDYRLAFIAKNSKKNMIDSIPLISGSSSAVPRIDPAVETTVIQLSNIPGIDFDKFMSRFFPDVPDSFFVRGTMTIDPPVIFAQPSAGYRIDDTTTMYPSFDMKFPVVLGIQNGVLSETILFGDQEKQKDITKSISQGTFTFYFTNKLPFKLFVHADLLGNYNHQTNKGDTLLLLTPSDTIQAASVDINGYTTTPAYSKATLTLNSSQMEQYNKADSLFIRFDITSSNNGQIVRVRDTDFIRVYAKGDILYTVNKQ
jgi:hypothetical protein